MPKSRPVAAVDVNSPLPAYPMRVTTARDACEEIVALARELAEETRQYRTRVLLECPALYALEPEEHYTLTDLRDALRIGIRRMRQITPR